MTPLSPHGIDDSERWLEILWTRILLNIHFICAKIYLFANTFFGTNCLDTQYLNPFFKLRIGALITRSVGRSVCLSVCLSSKNYKKNYKTLQNITKRYKTLQNTTKHWNKEFLSPPPFQLWRLSRKLRQYAGASLTESSFLPHSVQLGISTFL